MNTETTLLAAVVLAILIVAAVFAAVQGTMGQGEKGIDNITDRTDKDGDEFTFTSEEKGFTENIDRMEMEDGISL